MQQVKSAPNTPAELEKLRQQLLRLIVKNEARRRAVAR
jgi:hypothetical protein